MFTKAEYAHYFQMISEKEQAMVFALERLIPSVSDAALSSMLESILQEELAHNKLVCELVDRVMNPPSEARMQSRTHILGEARLQPTAGGDNISAHTLDYSLGGVCVELAVPLQIGDCFDVTAKFYESRNKVDRRVRVSWCKQAGPNRYRAGLAFEEA
ncbi:MAG: PilZ domain-containing protein [Deltaproteobacteria bacterium]|nr:PilZ domain-containing protein [Deltaproteobacteria bacterium]